VVSSLFPGAVIASISSDNWNLFGAPTLLLLPSPSPSLVFDDNWSILLMVLMDLVLSLVDWNYLMDLFDVGDDFVLALMVQVDDGLVDLSYVEVVLVDVVLVDSVLVQVVLERRTRFIIMTIYDDCIQCVCR
jgi:hypothetical protein